MLLIQQYELLFAYLALCCLEYLKRYCGNSHFEPYYSKMHMTLTSADIYLPLVLEKNQLKGLLMHCANIPQTFPDYQ